MLLVDGNYLSSTSSVQSHILREEQKAQPQIQNNLKGIAGQCLKSHVLLYRPPLRHLPLKKFVNETSFVLLSNSGKLLPSTASDLIGLLFNYHQDNDAQTKSTTYTSE